jgi:hypothetical protein
LIFQYILVDRRAVPCPDMLTWGRWMENSFDERVVAKSDVREFHISTVFLGIDHNWLPGPPVLFETMVFEGEDGLGKDMYRYSTWDEAKRGHEEVVRRLMGEAN